MVNTMKSLIIIWLLALVTIIGGGLYMNHAINGMIEQLPEEHTSVLTPQSTLEVVYNYQEQKTADIHVLEPKVSDVYYQNAPYIQQGTLVTPLVIYGTLDTDGLVRL